MEFIRVTADNLAAEHICCAISSNDDCQTASKKAWLAERFSDGLVFLKGNVRGKCFIEYLPAERAWVPVEADGYLYIDCLWVSGQWKGQGFAGELLNACVQDGKAQGKRGLVTLSAKKKQPFLSDPGFLRHAGFQAVDAAPPGYVLMALPFDPSAPMPKFGPSVTHPAVPSDGFVLYYSHQCPYTAKYVPVAEAAARTKGVPFRSVRFTSAEEAQRAPAPFTAYSLFHNGQFVTNEILSEAKLEKLFAGNNA